MKALLAFFALFYFHSVTLAGEEKLVTKDWVKRMADPADKGNLCYDDLEMLLNKFDSSKTFSFLEKLSDHTNAGNNYFNARYNCIKATELYMKHVNGNFRFSNEQIKKMIIDLLSEAMQQAYQANDDYLAAFVSGLYGSYLSIFGETESAVMYLMNSADLYDKIHLLGKSGNYVLLGEMLWRAREYEKCIYYSQKAITVLQTAPEKQKLTFSMYCCNTIALAYHRMGSYDSAFIYYRRGLAFAHQLNDPVWEGIISGNMGQIHYAQANYTTALPLFALDYSISKQNQYYDNAANSLQWTARTNLALGKPDTALRQVREAFGLLQKWPQSNYLQNAYFTAAEIFKTLKNNDSALYYSIQYNKLHDSIERVVYQSSISIAKLRLNDEKSRYSILKLQRIQQQQAQQRNLVIAGIFFLAILAAVLINRQRLKLKYQQQLINQEKARNEQEREAAKAQLKMFTESIIEKTNAIEQLEQQVNSSSTTNQETISVLSNLTILTEKDWENFKILFEKIYPLFFQTLQDKFPGITLAEQRMAALTRLHLTSRQMASMQGISPDSVHKTRQRLRMRLGVSNETNLEEFLAGL